MLRHFLLFAAAPGRQEEAERSLCAWLDAVKDAPQWHGGAVLRGRPGEFGEILPLALIYDVASADEGRVFKEFTKAVPSPMADDLPATNGPDQGAVLFGRASRPHPHDHEHGSQPLDRAAIETAQQSEPAGPMGALAFDRGGGLLARLMRIHFEPVVEAPASAVATRSVAEQA
ncbi:MAG: hypothetical protein ACRDTD_04280 [Pseudonocardiaceae bacterium]